MENKEKDFFAVVTDVGNAAMMAAVSKGEKLEIKEFAVGDGGGNCYEPDTSMTALKNEVWRGHINYCKISEESENILIINAILPGDAGGFTIREMGVFDTENRLIAICNTPETAKVKIADGVVNEMDLLMEIVLINNTSVELKVDPNIVTATKREIQDLREEVNDKFDHINDIAVRFEEFTERANITSGEKIGSLFGKIKKMITDLKNVAFTGSYADLKDKPQIGTIAGILPIDKGGTGATTAAAARDNLGLGDAATLNIANNSITTSPGYVLDARAANALQRQIDTHTGNAAVHITDAERTKWNAKQDKMAVDSALSTTSLNPVQNKVITAKVNEINSNLSDISQDLNGTVFIREGSGADTKYYIQTGADAASKKELGRPKRILVYSNKQMLGSWNDFYFDVPQARADATISDFCLNIRSFSSKNQTSVPYELSYRYDAVNKKIHMTTSIEFANAWAPYADLYYWEY